MQNLIVKSGQLTMNSLDLRDMINAARKEFGEPIVENSHFIKRVEDELDGELGKRNLFVNPDGGRPSAYYDLTIEQCTLVGMRESKGVRRQVLAKLKEKEQPRKLTQAEMTLIVISNLQEEVAQQAALIEQQKPAVEFVDNYVAASSGSKGFRQVAKLLQANEREFRNFLQAQGIMYRLGGEWMPYQNHIDAGRFEVKAGVSGEHAFNQSKFTAKGVKWVAGLWAQYKLEDSE